MEDGYRAEDGDIRIGYKVVRREGLNLFSMIVLSGRVRYGFDEYAKPEKGCGPLACFIGKREVLEFYREQLGRREVWRRGAEGMGIDGVELPSWEIYECEYYRWGGVGYLWNEVSEFGITAGGLPRGTILASGIRLRGKAIEV